MSHIGNDVIIDAQRDEIDECEVCEGLDVEVCIACGMEEHLTGRTK